MCHGGKPGTGKLYTDVCLCCSAHTSGCVVDGLGATAAFCIIITGYVSHISDYMKATEQSVIDVIQISFFEREWMRTLALHATQTTSSVQHGTVCYTDLNS